MVLLFRLSLDRLYLTAYFTIQLDFVIIHGCYCIFFVLFMSLTKLFQLTFSFIYIIFSKKFSVLAKGLFG